MSAPPIGTISKNPKASEMMTMSQSAVSDCPAQSQTISATMAIPWAAFKGCCIGKTSGLPETSPCSLAKATTEPVKVMAPMAMPIDISMRLATLMSPATPIP